MTTKNPHTAEEISNVGITVVGLSKKGKNVITPCNNEQKKLARACLTSY